jgi:hypothetical protein
VSSVRQRDEAGIVGPTLEWSWSVSGQPAWPAHHYWKRDQDAVYRIERGPGVAQSTTITYTAIVGA